LRLFVLLLALLLGNRCLPANGKERGSGAGETAHDVAAKDLR
jgi:hypothetical protein